MRPLLDKVVVWWALLGGAILLAIVLVTVANVGAFTLDRLARPFGERVAGLPGYEDFVRLAVSCAGLMLFPYCQLRRGHIAGPPSYLLFMRSVGTRISPRGIRAPA